ncbi:hypothetical protein RhiirC2_710940, partial [Rhizophagus irregularis]
QKYQKLDHLDDTIEPLSNSTFVSSNRKSRKSKSSDTTSLFDDWDNWKLDDQDLHNVRNKTTTPVGKLMKRYLSKETVSQDSVISSEDIDPHEISAAIANILQPENLEDMIRTAVNREVEKRVKLFFDNRADFIFSSSLSHLSSSLSHLLSAPQKWKYRDQNHVITTVMEFTKPLFMKMRNLSDTTLESIINAMWPEKPTFEDESDINVARSTSSLGKRMESYIIIERKYVTVLSFLFISGDLLLNVPKTFKEKYFSRKEMANLLELKQCSFPIKKNLRDEGTEKNY